MTPWLLVNLPLVPPSRVQFGVLGMISPEIVRQNHSDLYPLDSNGTLLFSTEHRQIGYETERNWSLRNLMTHYAMEQWVDFSRQVGDPQEHARMSGHLARGCGECSRLSG